MTTVPNDPITSLPGRPPVVDMATRQAARDELLVREKAHTREGDAIAATRRRRAGRWAGRADLLTRPRRSVRPGTGPSPSG